MATLCTPCTRARPQPCPCPYWRSSRRLATCCRMHDFSTTCSTMIPTGDHRAATVRFGLRTTPKAKSPCLISVTSVIGVLMLLIAVAFVMVMRKRRRQRRAELAAEQEAPAQAAKGAHGTERTTVGDSYTDLEARAADVSHRRISSSPRTFASKRLLSPRRHRCPSAHTRRAKRGRQASPACTALLLGSRLFC